MCGIVGIYGMYNEPVLVEMLKSIEHRGPDDSGIWGDINKSIILGSRRLSILDLSQTAHMPMLSRDGRVCITYNGEVYNFKLIRKELEAIGHVFETTGDTEVVLNAYRQWGKACIEKFRGMFAFAIWDSEREELFVARDRFGIKPLYWYMKNGIFLFSSEIKAILASGIIPRKVNHQALWDYLSIGAVPPPNTMIDGIFTLSPGCAMLLKDGKLTKWKYWDLDEASRLLSAPKTVEEATEELRENLEEAIEMHMISDVEVGAFLSGGLDSSCIVGLMSKKVGRPLNTFSIGFEKWDNVEDELSFAKLAAETFNSNHFEYVLTGQEVGRDLDRFFYSLDQPSVDGLNTYWVSKITSTRTKVVLSGLGADELFAGYPNFQSFMTAERILPQGSKAIERLCNKTLKLLPGRISIPMEFYFSSPLDRFASIRRIFTESDKKRIINNRKLAVGGMLPITNYYSRIIGRGQDIIEEVTYVEANGYMAHTLLRDSDAVSMAHSLELRVPFLDHKLAEFAYSLPAEMKLDGKKGKAILKRAIADLLPENIIGRKKMGFNLPLDRWLRTSLRNQAIDGLALAKNSGLLSDYGHNELKTAIDHNTYLKAWIIIVLSGWMDQMRVEL